MKDKDPRLEGTTRTEPSTSGDASGDPDVQPVDGLSDPSRRDLIKVIAKGAVYSSPVITTLLAPTRAQAQISGMMSMMTICDWWPILCMWLGGSVASLEEATTPPGTNVVGPPASTPPWAKGPPGSRDF